MSTSCEGCRTADAPFEFTMAFQPVVDLVLNRIVSHEALVRGRDGSSARQALAQVTKLNRYGFDQSCRVRAIELASSLGMTTRLNINFMPNAVYDPRACIRKTLETAARTGFPLNRITFEIVESEDIAETSHLAGIIREYRRHGFKVALDDFGTGYSGLVRLMDLRPDMVKLDRALVEGCDKDDAKRSIVESVVDMCRKLDVQLVAEGVETRGELDIVEAAGIRFVQGYYFARPAFEALLTDQDLPELVQRRHALVVLPEIGLDRLAMAAAVMLPETAMTN